MQASTNKNPGPPKSKMILEWTKPQTMVSFLFRPMFDLYQGDLDFGMSTVIQSWKIVGLERSSITSPADDWPTDRMAAKEPPKAPEDA